MSVVSKSKKSESSTGTLNGDRAMLSLVNNSLEIYHINSPEALSSSSSSSSSSANSSSSQKKESLKAGNKKSKKSKKGGDEVEDSPEDDEDEDDEDEGEEEAIVVEAIKVSREELVLKQSVIDLHGHR